MDEPPLKKARAESDFDGDGLDALSELEKLEPLGPGGGENENASTSGGSGGPSGSTPSSQQPPQQPTTSGFNLQPGSVPTQQPQSVPPSNGPSAGNGTGGSGGGSVLQELLMTQSQGANNSPRPPNQQFPAGAQQNPAFNRSPLMHNGSSTMMSPPNAMSGRVPGPSPGGQPGGPQMQAGRPAMYQPGAEPGQMMMGGQAAQQYPPAIMHRYAYGQAPGVVPPQYGGRGAATAAAIGGRGAPQMMNGAMGRGAQINAQGRGAGMPGQMMARGMMDPAYGQHQYHMHQAYGRGQHQYPMMHPHQQMMMDNGQQMRPAGQQMMMPMNGHPHPNMAHQNQAAAAAAAAAAAREAQNGRSSTPGGVMPLGQQDPEKRKLIQQQLVLLLHAHKCQQRERENVESRSNNGTAVHPPCNLPHCSTMKEVLQHMTSCNNGRGCPYPHCASSRQIIAHWKNCNREDCPVCKPLKKIQDNPVAMNEIMNSFPEVMSSFQSPVMRQIPNALFEGYNGDPFRLPNAPNQKLGGPMGRLERSTNDMNLPPPDCPGTSKEWHLQVTKDLRNHLVGKLVKSIFPEPDRSAVNDSRIKELVNYARKVERDMFESANDREEYYHLLAEKIYKIQKQLQEKQSHRLSQGGAAPQEPYQIPPSCELAEMMGVDRCKDVQQPGTSSSGQQPSLPPGSAPQSQDQPQQPPWMASAPNSMGTHPSQQQPSMQSHSQQQTPLLSNGASSMFSTNSGSSTPGMPPLQRTVDTPTQQSSQPTPSQISMIKKEDPMENGDGCMNGPSSSAGLVNGATIKQEEPDEPIVNPPNNNGNEKVIKKEEPDGKGEASSGGAATPKEPPIQREPTPPPAEDTVFSAEELKSFLLPIWEKLDKSEDAMPFRVPVDPILLNIPDYHNIVRHPMDLETIYKKMNSGQYKNAWQFCDDIWLMFDNAWLYNRKNSKVYKFGTKLSELFMTAMDPVMKAMGYCCSKKLSFTPLALFCYGAAMCTIARDQPYWVYETSSNQFNVVVSERYTYCTKCFDALPPEGISLSENPNDRTNMAGKEKFQQMKNNLIDFEPFENCKYCHRKWHRICALHDKKVFPEGFICDSCRASKKYPKAENRFLAKKLPHNKLSTFLEDRVNGYIKRSLQAEAYKYEVVIRTLCVQDKEVEVKPQMKSKYCQNGGNFPEKFPYRTKAVFAFEIIDGVEVCFFGLHVQEYGSNCPAPNARRVYIAYLDSVHFFQPRELRTEVYHEILLGYLDYAKKLGYTMAHIWACPPSEGDDYIFHCHPTEQKIPKPKRLQDWYKKMLEKGVQEKTVVEFKDIYKQARDDNLVTPSQLPYFEGDFWPNVIEDCIREASTEEAQRKVIKDEDMGDDENGDGDSGIGGASDKKSSKQNKKNNLKKNAKLNKKKQGSVTGNEVCDKLYSQFEKHKEVFFTIRLVSQQTELSVLATAISDPDPLMPSEMMDGRDTFLTRARDEHWEFSSLRRAKYSTLCLAHALHESDSSKVMEYSCNKCSSTNAKWHCNTCDDFDLCDACKLTTKHDHPMEPIKSLVGDTGADAGGNNRFESIQRCIQSLVHACQCRDANCRRMSCHKMKRVVQHTKMCKKRINGTCPVCKQLIALCCYHAKHCQRDSCSVPFCMNIRQKLAEQKRSLARRADMMMRRRMEGLQGASASSSMAAAASTPAPATPVTPSAPSTSNGGMGGGPQQHGGMKGGGIGGMQQQQQAQQQQQQQQHMMGAGGMGQQMTGLGGGQMGGKPGMPQHPMQQQRFMQSGNGTGIGGNVQQQQQMYGGMQRPGQMMTPQQIQQMQQQRAGAMGGMAGGNPQQFRQQQQQNPNFSGMMHLPQQMQQQGGNANVPNDPAIVSQLNKINNRLKNAQTAEERELVFADLKKTPHLFNAFLRQNGQNYMQQSQQQQQMMMSGGAPGTAGAAQAGQMRGGYQGQQQARGATGQFASMNAAQQQQVWQNQHAAAARANMAPGTQMYANRQMMMQHQQQLQQQQQQHQSNAGGK